MTTCNDCETVAHCLKHGCMPKVRSTIDMAREAGGRVQQNKNCDVECVMSSESLQRLIGSVRADEREAWERVCDQHLRHIAKVKRQHKAGILAEREACAAKIQAEIDHAYLNELRLVPSFGKRQGDIAVRAAHLEAALNAIRARGQA
jgi:hypothetical protein